MARRSASSARAGRAAKSVRRAGSRTLGYQSLINQILARYVARARSA